jgi:hypothetical protein
VQDIADSLVTGGQIMLPVGVAGILVGQRLANFEAVAVISERVGQVAKKWKPNINANRRVAVIFERVGQLTLNAKDIADSLVACGQITLPAGVAGILVGERLANVEAVAVALKRPL